MKYFTMMDLSEAIQDDKLLQQAMSFVMNKTSPVGSQPIRISGKKKGSVIIKPFTTYSVRNVLIMVRRLLQQDDSRFKKYYTQWMEMERIFEGLNSKQIVKRGSKVWR